ncbi:MAG: patatin-like phospholipase family protein [Chloroflexota bacterium]|nr:MAG: patatin-like phospholipase family protein [Chloroflexota bacterium]
MKFGLALGGGGARGAAHIGVLMELEQHGLWPDIVAGTSIGGLVSALIASGQHAAEIKAVFAQMRFGKMFSLPWQKPAIMDNRRLERLLVKSIGRPTFSDLKIPLAVMATVLEERKVVVLDKGDVVKAVLATTAFPVALPPVAWQGKTLVDGGVLNNTPFDVAREMGANIVLGVDLANSAPYGTPVEAPPKSGLLHRLLSRAQGDPMYQAVSTLADIVTYQNVINHLEQSPPDLLLRPEIGTIGLFDFHRLDEGIRVGRQSAKEEVTTFKAWSHELEIAWA